ncbi:protein of unknown function [Pseudonocardia thermophila]|uniref:DUF4350 domain-containing protein n=1 Tax=Pseudonocardia thermophila TaxID=1848 RepID=A0A1M6PAR7_PSETH|nr:DUF4350 domain-containing protein [Pseudonocardia thermophila]SHK05061.1 protein of unknown function [Pseudonocardia thermophila]
MTAPTEPPTALRRDPRALWRAARGPLAIAALLLAVAVVVAALSPRTNRGVLDPQSPAQQGSMALATLLRERGVTVEEARTSADLHDVGRGATVLVPFPERLSRIQLDALAATEADLVLLAPSDGQLEVLAPGVTVDSRTGSEIPMPAACLLPAAVAAGPAVTGAVTYRAPRDAITCYPDEHGAAALVQVRAGGRTVVVLGGDDAFTNADLADEGNAALAMNLLGAHPRLVWFRAVPEGVPVDEQRSLTELLPEGWVWATYMGWVTALLAVLWRARRLGRVVVEPLPVAVRAAEAVEGRARLYRRARARGHAAEVLRDAARNRLATLVGTGDRTGMVAAVAARTGRAPAAVDALLYGPPPVDDSAMIELARALDACEAEVRRA